MSLFVCILPIIELINCDFIDISFHMFSITFNSIFLCSLSKFSFFLMLKLFLTKFAGKIFFHFFLLNIL